MTKPGAKSHSMVTEGGGAASLVWGERYGNGTDVDVARGYPISVTVSAVFFSADWPFGILGSDEFGWHVRCVAHRDNLRTLYVRG